MSKYFRCCLELDEDVPITAEMLTDANLETFVAYMWVNDKSRSQMRKLQGWFKDRRSDFGLPNPNSGNHLDQFRWKGYLAALQGVQRDPAWNKKPKNKICLDDEQVIYLGRDLHYMMFGEMKE